MLSSQRKLSLIAGLAALVVFSVGVGCKGFFVNQPNSVTVTPSTLSVAQGATGKLSATASYSSGNKDVTNSASWQSSSPCATVSAGLVKGVGAASSITITATLAGVSGTATVTVTGGTSQTITINPPSGTFTNGTSQQFTAALNGSDVTSSTTWTSSNTSIVSFSTTTNGLASFVGPGTATVTASLTSGTTCATGSESITVQ